ncbi:MAG TPA: AAA family ATPase [bacterium]|nr:AAA family ATPase [bacterium]
MDKLSKITLRGFKSIRSLDELTLRNINVLIGANGAGKSNLISFFKMLNWMTPSTGNLQFIIGKSGGANALLHDGASLTPQIEASLSFESDKGLNEYYMRLFYAAPDTLRFADERYRFSRKGLPTSAEWKTLESGHSETRLIAAADNGDQTAKTILWILKSCVVYQFHNTSETARIRQKWDIEDNRFLKEDGANLAPFLYLLNKTRPEYYRRIVDTIRQIAPFFGDFIFEPENGKVLLKWQERESDMLFGAHQASDGTLRMFALVSLLLQPENCLPSVIILDEPELGLHPYAINVISGLLKSVSVNRQVILATQSTTFIDYFDPEDVVVVERPGRESFFKRLEPEKLDQWLDEYSMAELWEKNVIGGRP